MKTLAFIPIMMNNERLPDYSHRSCKGGGVG